MSEDITLPKPSIMAFGRTQQRLATSLDLTDKKNRLLMMSCLNDCDARITEEVGNVIDVVDYFIHDVQKVDQKTGEVKDLERLVLIDKDGTTHETTGGTLIESLKYVCFAVGSPPPWKDGQKLKVRMKKKDVNNIYFFEVVE
jgi:hypothetical protein